MMTKEYVAFLLVEHAVLTSCLLTWFTVPWEPQQRIRQGACFQGIESTLGKNDKST